MLVTVSQMSLDVPQRRQIRPAAYRNTGYVTALSTASTGVMRVMCVQHLLSMVNNKFIPLLFFCFNIIMKAQYRYCSASLNRTKTKKIFSQISIFVVVHQGCLDNSLCCFPHR